MSELPCPYCGYNCEIPSDTEEKIECTSCRSIFLYIKNSKSHGTIDYRPSPEINVGGVQMSELKVINLGDIRWSIENNKPVHYDYYAKSKVDAVLAAKDKEIAELKDKLQAAEKQTENLINSASSLMLKQDTANDKLDAEIRRLNLKYWNDKADEAAKMKRLIYDGEIRYLDEYCNEKDWRIMYKVWEDEETKCRAKAEEYK